MQFFKYSLFFSFLFCLSFFHLDAKNNDIRILVLVIASEDHPVYPQLQKIWKAYMHLDRKHIQSFFIKRGP